MNRSFLQHALIALALAIGCHLAYTGTPAAQACPMCSEALSNPGDAQSSSGGPAPADDSLARGFYYSILFMLAVPFSLVTGLGTVLYINVRKADQAQINNPQAINPSNSPPHHD